MAHRCRRKKGWRLFELGLGELWFEVVVQAFATT